jgi:osmotically-inducible protein OsmY
MTLTGGVDTTAQKKKAEEFARGVKGFAGANNLLGIKKP